MQLLVQAVVGGNVFTCVHIVQLQVAQEDPAAGLGQQAKDAVLLELIGEVGRPDSERCGMARSVCKEGVSGCHTCVVAARRVYPLGV